MGGVLSALYQEMILNNGIILVLIDELIPSPLCSLKVHVLKSSTFFWHIAFLIVELSTIKYYSVLK